jgi:tRNA A37 threonylcarbamoyladenosine dehydratase
MTAPSLHPTPSGPSPAETARAFRLSRRWDRTGRLLGDEAMERLARARVIVFGLGGVGSYAVEGLVRSGIGQLTLVDFDEVCVTNLNRQLHATVRTVGKSKAELMAQRCREVNPDCRVEAVAEFYRAETS